MGELILQIIIGFSLIILGIINMKGNISMLHSYHRKRVKKEDIIPYGKKVGTGIIIIGISIIIAGLFTIFNYTNISNDILIIGLVVGTIIIFCAMFKYNKGIFWKNKLQFLKQIEISVFSMSISYLGVEKRLKNAKVKYAFINDFKRV